MIVRCTNCVSAFAVDDEKVANKKFAFTCPKCGTENIFDNRKTGRDLAEEDIFFEEKDMPAEKPLQDKKPAVAVSSGAEEDLFAEDILSETPKTKKGINLEIEETPAGEEISFDEEDLFAEEKPAKKAPIEEEILFDEEGLIVGETPAEKMKGEYELDFEEKPAKADIAEEDVLLDDFTIEETPATSKKKEPEESEPPELEDIFAEEKPVKKALLEEEILFDEEEFPVEEKPAKKAPIEEEILFDEEELLAEEKPAEKAPLEEDVFLDDFTIDESPAPQKKKPSAEDEILFDEELEVEEKPSKKGTAEDELLFDEEFIIDESETPAEAKKGREDEFAEIGLELEESPEKPASDREVKISSQDDIDALFAAAPSERDFEEKESAKKDVLPEDDITVNLDELDIDLEEETTPSTGEFVSFDETGKARSSETKKEEEPLFDEDITIDMDALDIDIEEAGDFHKPAKEDTARKKPVKPEPEEEDLVLTIDEFGEELETSVAPSEAPDAKSRKKNIPEEEDITLDLDKLDIDLDEGEATVTATKSKKDKTVPLHDEEESSSEEELKLNLDDLDMDIEEFEKKELVFDDEIPEELAEKPKKKPAADEEEEDESITIDLDTLDIEVSETQDIMKGEMTEEEEKLTLDDAGLTFSELTGEELKNEFAETAEEEIKLTLDEIDPDLKLQVIGETAPKGEKLLIETVDELPEIDLDEYEAVIREEKSIPERMHEEIDLSQDEFIDLEIPGAAGTKGKLDILEYDEEAEPDYLPEKGSTSFSIDFSLKYSRFGAILRLLGLYILSLIPHFVLILVYTILSGILGFINQIVILSTGRCVEDFSLITENTLRYYLYIKTNITGIVEDRPVYAGRESLNHQLQLDVTYPVKYSKNFAILRLSIIGIWLITLPHFIIMSMLTVAVPFVYLAGIITVIVTSRWPNPLFIFLTRYFRYAARISSFLIGLTDEYPPFRFD